MRRSLLASLWVCSILAVAVPVRAAGWQTPAGASLYARGVLRDAHFYWGLQAPVGVFFGQIHQESRWRARVESPYAAGLAQFTPATAADIIRLYPADLADVCKDAGDCRFDVGWAIRAMVLYDKQLFGGFQFANGDERWGFTLAAYNGGAGWLRRERRYCIEAAACDAERYFIGGVKNACGETEPARSEQSCIENGSYPVLILFEWRPLYEEWLRAR
jgi:hypothetical protein